MKIYLCNEKKEISFDEQKAFLASGGEGSIYRVKNTIYKIYSDVNHMVPEEKLRELMELKKSNIATPIDLIRNIKTNAIVGYTMNFIDGMGLCRLYSTNFLDDNDITNKMISEYCDNFIEVVQFVHDHSCLVVDWNEMNFMIDKTFKIPYFIDTNAWKTKSFPPNAITPLFMDYSTKKLSEMTDWYGFAIITCNLYTGIHPYRGTHPNYTRKIDDVIQRMKDNISIFNKDTKLPPATRDFDFIPDSYMKWFIKVFEKGERSLPPHAAGFVTVVKKKIDTVFKYFTASIYKLSFHPNGKEIKRYYNINGVDVGFFDDDIVINDKIVSVRDKSIKLGVLISQKNKIPYFVFVKNEKLQIYDIDKKKINFDIAAEDFLVYNDLIYVYNNGKITQVICADIGINQIFSIGQTWDATLYSTKVLGNCFFMSIMGKAHVFYPTNSTSGRQFLRIVRLEELDSYEVVEAKSDENVLMFVGFKDQKYDRFLYVLDKINDDKYIEIDNDIGTPYINFVILDNGVGVSMNENGEIKIFITNVKKYQSKTIFDDSIKKGIRLFKSGTKVLFADGAKLYHLSVAKKP